jgi:outer membrane protein
MKNTIKTLVAIAAFGAFSLAASAQPAFKLLVVDISKLFDNHYQTVELTAKIHSDDTKATEEVEKMNKEGNALVEEYKALLEQANNPALTVEAKSKAQGDAQKKLEAINKKQDDIQRFIADTRQILQQRFLNFKTVMLDELTKMASDVAKRKGATLLIDKSGPTGNGISSIIYSDPAYDITDEVMKEINKDRPANAPAAAPATTGTPAPAAAAPAAAAPASGSISVPGLTPTKK